MKTFHCLHCLTKPAKGFPPQWVEYWSNDSFEECKEETDETLHRYGVIGFTVVTITEVDPETLKPVGPPITYTP